MATKTGIRTQIRSGGPRKIERGSGESGYSLIELMISLFITFIVVGGVLMSFLTQHNAAIRQDGIAETQSNLRAGMLILKRDLRNVGFRLADANSLQIGNNTGLNATDQITVLSGGLGEDRIHYEIKNVGGVSTLIRNTDPGGNPAADLPVISNVDDLQLAYAWDADGDNQIQAGEWINDATGNEGRVRLIRINLLVRSRNRDPNMSNYVRPALEDHAGGTTTDSFTRRLLTTVVHIRNKAL